MHEGANRDEGLRVDRLGILLMLDICFWDRIGRASRRDPSGIRNLKGRCR